MLRSQYSKRTEEASIMWARQDIWFHHKRPLKKVGLPEIAQFLSETGRDHHVAGITQNQVLCAFHVLYREVLCLIANLPEKRLDKFFPEQ